MEENESHRSKERGMKEDEDINERKMCVSFAQLGGKRERWNEGRKSCKGKRVATSRGLGKWSDHATKGKQTKE